MKKLLMLCVIVLISSIASAQVVEEVDGSIYINNHGEHNAGRVNVRLNGDQWEHALFCSDSTNTHQIMLGNGGYGKSYSCLFGTSRITC